MDFLLCEKTANAARAKKKAKMKKTITKTGVVADLNGKYFGVQHEDGRFTECGFGEIENAKVSDPAFCKKPENKSYIGSQHIEQLRKSKLVKVKITTIYEIEDGQETQ